MRQSSSIRRPGPGAFPSAGHRSSPDSDPQPHPTAPGRQCTRGTGHTPYERSPDSRSPDSGSQPDSGPHPFSYAALPTPTVDLARQIARGERLVERNSCLQCHTIDGQANFAPTLAGLFGTLRELEGGGTTIADEAYLRQSIKDPDEKIVSGFATGAMPKVFFSDAELGALVEYVKSLQ